MVLLWPLVSSCNPPLAPGYLAAKVAAGPTAGAWGTRSAGTGHAGPCGPACIGGGTGVAGKSGTECQKLVSWKVVI